MKSALVTGLAGQDGFHLARLLLREGYRVHGTVRPGASAALGRDALPPEAASRIEVHALDLADAEGVATVVERVRPDEVYHLAGESQVGRSLELPLASAEVTAMATLRLLESVRRSGRPIRFFLAASAEMFGDPQESPQDEETPMRPTNPYGVAKLFAHGMVGTYRRRYGVFACSGILYNHESPQRGEGFVTRQIARAAAVAAAGGTERLHLRSLDARRDWGYAGDFVEGFHRMLQAETPDDYVLATGRTHSVRELAEIAYARVGLDWRDHVSGREQETGGTDLRGCAARAAERLGWQARLPFRDLVHLMVDAECERLGRTT
jgi:GDPmannose 4,6-dehydratase